MSKRRSADASLPANAIQAASQGVNIRQWTLGPELHALLGLKPCRLVLKLARETLIPRGRRTYTITLVS